VYGLGGDAFNPLSLAKIFEVKGRPRFDPLIVHIAAFETLETIADLSLLDAAAKKNLAVLTQQFWPGPLTLILPKQKAVPDLATSGLPSVAVRLPDHDAARRLIALSTGAVAAPSANPFGYLSPTRAEHVAAMLGEKIDIILDGGAARFGLESTVLDMTGEKPRILRPGAVPKEAIEALVGSVACGSSITNNAPVSPGMLKSHYAPRVPLMTHNGTPPHELEVDGAACHNVACHDVALLFFDGASRDRWLSVSPTGTKPAVVAVLSETGDLTEAAARLFETLHELDRPGVRRIYAQLAPEENLGVAINDRLRRAEDTHGKE
jgi:L-threonylcarbamoyladenylate synthase